jgi:hypothetical protein
MFLEESEETEPHIARYLRNEKKKSLKFLGTKKVEAILGRSLLFFRFRNEKNLSANKKLSLTATAGVLRNPKKLSLTRIPSSFLNARL